EYEVGSFTANLQSEAAALKRKHARCAPRPGEILSSAADHGAAAVAAGHDEASFLDGGEDDDAFSLVEEVMRNAFIGHIEDFFQDVARLFQPVFFLFLSEGGEREKQTQQHNRELFHSVILSMIHKRPRR